MEKTHQLVTHHASKQEEGKQKSSNKRKKSTRKPRTTMSMKTTFMGHWLWIISSPSLPLLANRTVQFSFSRKRPMTAGESGEERQRETERERVRERGREECV